MEEGSPCGTVEGKVLMKQVYLGALQFSPANYLSISVPIETYTN
jgi:hypothetical protein